MFNIKKINKELFVGNLKIYGYIYKIENVINNKVYIGQTRQLFKERYKGKWYKNTSSIKLKNAYLKYGEDNFKISIIDYAFSEKELNIKEKSYIQHIYNSRCNGYNLTDGGEGVSSYIWTEEQRDKRRQKIVKLDLNKKYLSEFNSIDEAENLDNIENISFCCRGKYKSSGGYIWLYKDDYEYLLNNNSLEDYRKYLCDKYEYRYTNNNYIETYQLDNNLNIIKLWEGVKIAEKELGISNITAVCKGRQKTSGGYVWCYKSDYDYVKENNLIQSEFRVYVANKYSKQKYIPKENKKIVQLDLDFNTIKVWDRIVDIENQLNINNSNISAICRGKRNMAKNNYFMYLDDYNEIKDYKYSLEEVKQWLKEKYK